MHRGHGVWARQGKVLIVFPGSGQLDPCSSPTQVAHSLLVASLDSFLSFCWKVN